MKIVVLDGHTLNPGDLSWGAIEAFGDLTIHDRTPREKVCERAAGVTVLLTNKTPITAADIAALPELRYIGVLATGTNVVDTGAARERGIVVCNVPEYGTRAVAQFTIALILEWAHRIGDHHRGVLDGAWGRSGDFCFTLSPQVELAGKSIGIVGFGRIGREVGRIAHALGMEVLGQSSSRSTEAEYPFRWSTIPEIFATSDVVTLHCPQTPETTGMVNRALLSTMKKSALLVNTARGALVSEAELAEALREGLLAGAALDVVSREPISPDNPLLTAPNVILTPHMAWTAKSARERLMETAAENIRAWIAGAPQNRVG